jgi:hypothetical protein
MIIMDLLRYGVEICVRNCESIERFPQRLRWTDFGHPEHRQLMPIVILPDFGALGE